MPDMDERLRAAPVGVLEVSADGTVSDLNTAARELIGAATASSGEPIEDVFPRSVEDSLLDAFQGADVSDAEFEEYYPDVERWLAISVVPTDERVTVYLQDVTRRRRHEQSVTQLRDERKRIAVIDEVLSDVLAELVGASSRDEIAETICRALGETERYEFVWVGEREVGGDTLTIRAVAGTTGETFAAVREALEEPSTTPEERAVETGALQTAQPLESNSHGRICRRGAVGAGDSARVRIERPRGGRSLRGQERRLFREGAAEFRDTRRNGRIRCDCCPEPESPALG